MKLGIMQPYFLPYIGYFQLINAVDEFILFDTPQFIRHGWIERNYILNINGVKNYIKVPLVKHKRETPIKEVAIKNSINWQAKIFAQLTHYKKKAPYYNQVISTLELIFKNNTDSIANLNLISIKVICEYLKIETPIKMWSQMNIQIEKPTSADEWALNICKKIEATEYINPIGGVSFFDKTKYFENNIDIKFLMCDEIKYKQFNNCFTPWLSIIDVMMFNSKKEIRQMLHCYHLKYDF